MKRQAQGLQSLGFDKCCYNTPMTDAASLPTLSETDRQVLQTCLADLEQNWYEHKLAEMVPRLPPPDHPLRAIILLNLASIDIARHWHAGRQRNVEAYLALYPELGMPETVPLELIQVEFDARFIGGFEDSVGGDKKDVAGTKLN